MDKVVHKWHDESIPEELTSREPRLSHCQLEVDLHVSDILNRENVEPRDIHHDFIERHHPIPGDLKLVQSMASLWKDETKRRKRRLGITNESSSPFGPDVLVTMSADPRNSQKGGWIHEDEFRDKVAQIAKQESGDSQGLNVTYNTFVRPVPFENTVKTVLQSVEDLYIENLPKPAPQQNGNNGEFFAEHSASQAIIDEGKILQLARESSEGEESKDTSLPSATKSSDEQLKRKIDHSGAGHGGLEVKLRDEEFEGLGVHKSGNPSQFEADAFDIPAEFFGTKRNGNVKRKSAEIMGLQPASPRKRQRLWDNEIVLSEAARATTLKDEKWQDGAYLSGGTLRTPELVPELTPLTNGTQRTVKAASSDSKSVALPTSFPKGAGQDGRLSYTVVKDPHDPDTLLRLSQRSSSSPIKTSQKLNEKSVKTVRFSDAITPRRPPDRAYMKTPKTTDSQRGSTFTQLPKLSIKGFVRPSKHLQTLIYNSRPPKKELVRAEMIELDLPDVIYQPAYYSNEDDVPDAAREYAGREFKLESTTVPWLPDFDPRGSSAASTGQKEPVVVDELAEELADNRRRRACDVTKWRIGDRPPSRKMVENWLLIKRRAQVRKEIANSPKKKKVPTSQIEGPTQKNKHGFKYSQKQDSTSVQHETQYMSLMALEVHVNTRGQLAPNPEEDEIACIFWSVQSDDEDLKTDTNGDGKFSGVLMLAGRDGLEDNIAHILGLTENIQIEDTEIDLITSLTDIVRRYDPDILTGYEVHNSSWGYVIERARFKYELNLCDELSRMKSLSHGRFGKEEDRWGFNQTSTIRVTGRHTINVWRAMRGEMNLLQYTMENVVYHLLHRRIPHYSFHTLTSWWKSNTSRDLTKVVEYFMSRCQMDLEILEANELVPRTSEQARLLGVDWFSVISRGSQFKVESLMFRIAKPENFLLVSPSRRQVGGQNALECLPLVMEPQSDFYTSPLLVLDFQSLYPSVMIAYNYCYSTFLGRVVSWRGTNKMGFTTYHRTPGLINLLEKDINIAPNGIMYAKPHIRKSLLAKMLAEILETRVMVKSGMKVDKEDKTLQRLLNNRQLALKLIANVTYGYTSASFSGRMPCSEIADSIVQTGRETLEKAIAIIHATSRWGAEVVYGDTDSLFVYLKGRSRDQAFDIGDDIAKTITKMNPRPVKLKFEKVYHPCVLLAKKRYVGFKYESRTQKEPDFDAKGIETVRRDGTPAEQKIEEACLKTLFRTSDLTKVKAYFQDQCEKVMRGKVSVQDFCFAKEVRLGTYSDKGPPPPGALISARRMAEDPRLEPQYGERVPYVVVTGGPQARLIDRCVAPEVLVNDPQSELDAEYYISKNLIPPLERIFNLVGANVRQWYDDMPKFQRIRRVETAATAVDAKDLALALSKKTLENYMKSSNCVVCREELLQESEFPICESCFGQPAHTLVVLRTRLARAERKRAGINKICRTCSGMAAGEEVKCDSKDCPVFYSRVRQKAEVKHVYAEVGPMTKLLEEKGGELLNW